jgi:hypothetical protein
MNGLTNMIFYTLRDATGACLLGCVFGGLFDSQMIGAIIGFSVYLIYRLYMWIVD